jgi:hypothetical protein
MGVSVVDYRAIEAGERNAGSDTFDAICQLFGWPSLLGSLGFPCLIALETHVGDTLLMLVPSLSGC